MWTVIKRKINRFLAGLLILLLAWWARRFAGAVLLVSVIFGSVLYLRTKVGPWADGVGHFSSLMVPWGLFSLSLGIFVWACGARSIEPAKKSSVLDWPEDEREPDAQVYEMYPNDEMENAS